jgi:two-component system NtrC family sensor kinase
MVGDAGSSTLTVVGDSPFAGSRVLVVDDEPVNRQVLRTQLASEGYIVTECPGGVEALELCEKGLDVDIILLDVMMPKVNGYDVCKRVRSQFSRQQMPIVFLTARTQAEDIVSGLACGANDYLAKPFSRDELVERVRIHLQIVKARQELEQQNDQLVDAQKKMLSQEKMATLGLLSAGLAHEINNPNNFVKTSAENLKYDLGKFETYLAELMSDDVEQELKDEFARRFSGFSHHLDLVREGCVRIADIVQSMRNSSRKDAEFTDNVDIVSHLEKTLTLVKTTYKNTVRFELEAEVRPLVRCSGGQMNQVFLNLLVNACHAIESRQEATGTRDPGVVKVITRSVEGMLAVGIKDNGCGMSEAVKQKLFEPFFTTKGAVKGTGLGMSISREIVDAAGGKIEVLSEEGVGTEIWIRIPLPDVGMQRTA